MSKYPFLDRIPPDFRLTALNDLQKYQSNRHHNLLDATRDFRDGRYNPLETQDEPIIIISQDTEQDEIDEVNYEMSQNTDVKERIE